MIQIEAEVAELKPKAFKVMKRLDADVNVDLLSKTVISVVSDEHHRHPVITGVTRNLFRATAIYNIHEFFSPVASVKGQVNTYRTRQKSNDLSGEKRDATFHLRVLRYAPDHTVFPVATIKKRSVLLLFQIGKTGSFVNSDGIARR
jgi:hypothetical protein